ncbi:MAG TPA: hypothetical protein PLC21_09715 [Deltaproteobacteria bacterium]|nr:hypothetical protein [Deltaproteobacteria bacterium]
MKKAMFLLAIVMFPLSAAAMQPLDETDLSLITGRSGVSFFVDVTMDIHIDTLAWGDSDGLAPGPYNPWNIEASGGYVGVTNFTMNGLSVRPYFADPFSAYTVSPNSVSFWPQASTIDVHNGIPYYRVHAGPGRH